jgi:hypothetical protein
MKLSGTEDITAAMANQLKMMKYKEELDVLKMERKDCQALVNVQG